ncbi:MAG: hypothetical protein FWD26_03040 [Treponema sp.]|nr:hypothetical protein [Treponema sp.]
MKKLTLFLLFTIICTAAFAQFQVVVPGADGEAAFTYQANAPDPVIRQLPREITSRRQNAPLEFIQLLADYINEKAECEYDKVKKVHDWVALNIRYDTQSYFSGRYAPQDFTSVIRRGNAVCAGYAEVFKYICDILKIECNIINGYARGYSSSLFRFTDVTNSNHAWNMVTINGKSYLIDTTWNAGYVSGQGFQAKYRTDYLFINPAIFIYDHLPTYSVHQLLEQPLSAEEFDNLPFLKPEFFQSVKSWPQELTRITEITEEDILEFEMNEGYELNYIWFTQSGTRISSHFPARIARFGIPKQRTGRLLLRIYVKKPGDRMYWSCGEFGFQIK